VTKLCIRLCVAFTIILVYGCTAPNQHGANIQGSGLSFACLSGDVTAHEAIVWFRTKGPARVSTRFGTQADLDRFAATQPVRTKKETDFTVTFGLTGLLPQTRYYYRGAVVGRTPGPICTFKTAPLPEDPVNVTFAFSGDTEEDHQPFAIMDSIRAMHPDFFLFLGDTIYADKGGKAGHRAAFWEKYLANRQDAPTQRLLASTSVYVTWDDHEVKNNYHPTHPLAPVGRQAFFDYWPVRKQPAEPHRLYRSFRWGRAVELFVLDARQYRDLEVGSMLGEDQKRWFLRGLRNSNAWFKLVATSVPFSGRGQDKWGGYSPERDEILRYIATHNVSGVIFLTADVHYAAVVKVPGDLGLKEFIVGPLGTHMNRRSQGTARRFEFFYKEAVNYGLVRVNAAAQPPYADIEILDAENNLLSRTRITSSGPVYPLSRVGEGVKSLAGK